MKASRKILVLGNSHTDAIKRAVVAEDDISVHWIKAPKSVHGDTDMDTAYQKIAALTPDDCLVVLHFGAMHNVIGLLNHEQPFTLVDGTAETTQSTMIPRAVMKAMMVSHISRKNMVSALVEKAPCPPFHLVSPPPHEILTMPKDSGKSYNGHSIQEMGFTPAAQRLAMWRLEEETIAQYLKTIGVTHIGAVPGTQTEAGYLHPDYCAVDNTHANAAYGARIIDHLRSLRAAVSAP
jgi:hypothetical protein